MSVYTTGLWNVLIRFSGEHYKVCNYFQGKAWLKYSFKQVLTALHCPYDFSYFKGPCSLQQNINK